MLISVSTALDQVIVLQNKKVRKTKHFNNMLYKLKLHI